MTLNPNTINVCPSVIRPYFWPVISPQSTGWFQSVLICSMSLVGHQWHKLFIEIKWKLWLLWQPQGSIDLQWENACHHHNSFSFDWMFLKLAGKVDRRKISYSVKNWPDWIINLRVMSPWLLKKPSLFPDFSRRGLLKWTRPSVCPYICQVHWEVSVYIGVWFIPSLWG